MPRKPTRRQCPRCATWNPGASKTCDQCHTPLVRRRFRMSPDRVKYLHVLALQQKGLQYDDYKARLARIGCATCKELTGRQYREFVNDLRRLPDAPKRASRGHR